MEKKNFLWSMLAIVMAATMSMSLLSCGSDDDDDPTPPKIDITVNGADHAEHIFPGIFGSGKSGIDYKQVFKIKSNIQWSLSGQVDWLNVSPTSGNGDVDLTIYPSSENSMTTERKATITLSSSGGSVNIEITQQPGMDANLDVSPNTIITLANGFAFDFNYGSNVKYYYVARYLPSSLERKTDDEIIGEMSSNPSNRDTPSDGYVTSWQNQDPSTEYIICTVGYSQDGKHGALKKTSITTKKGTNQAVATISDVQYDDTYWYWSTSVNGFVTKYYMWFITNTNLYNTTDAAIAWFFDKAMKTNPNDFSPIAQGDRWQKLRNSGTLFHVATWALDVDGNFSGVIDRFSGSINSKSIMQNYIEIPDASQRIKTIK